MPGSPDVHVRFLVDHSEWVASPDSVVVALFVAAGADLWLTENHADALLALGVVELVGDSDDAIPKPPAPQGRH